MRLLLFGGTFDPPHVGHLRMALEASESLAPAHCLWIPTGRPPHKAGPRLAGEARLALLQAALAELAQHSTTPMSVDPIELVDDGPRYTVDTLEALRQRWPDASLNWLVGMDSLAALHTWHRPLEILALANLIVAPRPGYAWPGDGPMAEDLARRRTSLADLPLAGAVAQLPTPPLAVASSDVRVRLAAGRNTAYLLSPAVATLINRRGYYRAPDEDRSA